MKYYIIAWSSKVKVRPECIRISDKTDSEVSAGKYCFGCYSKFMTSVSTTKVRDLQTNKRRLALIAELENKHAARFASGELKEE